MSEPLWQARTKRDLIIEVWEWLDCESVGGREIQAIAEIARARYGAGADESPMALARLLADEGAELRHPEIMALDVIWRTSDKYDAMFRNALKCDDLAQTFQSLRRLENLRQQFLREPDREGQRRLRELALQAKKRAAALAQDSKTPAPQRDENAEIAEWFTVWLNSPGLFNGWLELRIKAPDFKQKFAVE